MNGHESNETAARLGVRDQRVLSGSLIGERRQRGLDRKAGKHRGRGDERSTEVMRIARPDDLTDLATLGLTMAEGKQLLASVQQELVARKRGARRAPPGVPQL